MRNCFTSHSAAEPVPRQSHNLIARNVGNHLGLCENFPSHMPSPARKKVAGTTFVLLLLVAAGAALYAYFHPGPWIVPEEAKRVQNPLQPSQADLPGARKLYLDK